MTTDKRTEIPTYVPPAEPTRSSRLRSTPARVVGRVVAVPLNVVFVAATLVGSTILGIGLLSNLGAERLRRRGSSSWGYTEYSVDEGGEGGEVGKLVE